MPDNKVLTLLLIIAGFIVCVKYLEIIVICALIAGVVWIIFANTATQKSKSFSKTKEEKKVKPRPQNGFPSQPRKRVENLASVQYEVEKDEKSFVESS